jgi:hypothetical protein
MLGNNKDYIEITQLSQDLEDEINRSTLEYYNNKKRKQLSNNNIDNKIKTNIIEKRNHTNNDNDIDNNNNNKNNNNNLVEIKLDENKTKTNIIEKENKSNNLFINFTIFVIFIINSLIFLILNILNYPKDSFHEYNKIIYNRYLYGDYIILILYFYKKNYKLFHKKINIIILIYANIMIGYCLYVDISYYNVLNKFDTILFSLLFFRYLIYIFQLI